MSKYRINVRFDLDKPKEAKAAQYLQSLDKSRNAFMVTAVLNDGVVPCKCSRKIPKNLLN